MQLDSKLCYNHDGNERLQIICKNYMEYLQKRSFSTDRYYTFPREYNAQGITTSELEVAFTLTHSLCNVRSSECF